MQWNRANGTPCIVAFERWPFFTGATVDVTIIRRYLSTEDVCLPCGGGIRVAVGKVNGEIRVFRLECLVCGWTTDALPDPKAGV